MPPNPLSLHDRRRAGGTLADLRGLLRLAVDGIHGATRIAQGLHGNISSLAPPVGRMRERPARGIAGFVYGAVRTGSSAAGSSLDALLSALEALLPSTGAPAIALPGRQAVVAALNGVMGDHLARTRNPLATPMALITCGDVRPKLLLFVHGLCMSEAQWQAGGEDSWRGLAESLDCSQVYVRYNSGRHVSENGAELATQLEELVAHWPVAVESIAIVGHSMGGLVARSALHQAQQDGLQWPARVRQMVFLGTPHHGAALERAGNWLHTVLGASPYLSPFTRLGRLRSDGITDLRHGNVLAADWQAGRYLHRDTRSAAPLPAGVACFAVAGALGPRAADTAIGDGLVSIDSALGRHPRRTHHLRIPASRTWVARGVGHLGLLSDAAVIAKVRAWLR